MLISHGLSHRMFVSRLSQYSFCVLLFVGTTWASLSCSDKFLIPTRHLRCDLREHFIFCIANYIPTACSFDRPFLGCRSSTVLFATNVACGELYSNVVRGGAPQQLCSWGSSPAMQLFGSNAITFMYLNVLHLL